MFTLAGGAATAWGQLDPNDPHAKFAHDERNTCFTTHAGPHVKPELRWWACLEGDEGSDYEEYHLRGPAMARLGLGSVRYVLIGTRDVSGDTESGRVLIFRYHPDAQHWGPGELEAQPVATIPLTSPVNSTPLVMPNDWVAIQTEATIEVWNLQSPASPQRVWRADVVSSGSSPAYGSQEAGGQYGYLYVLGDGGVLYCVDPNQESRDEAYDLATVSEWHFTLCQDELHLDQGKTSPAVGPIADDPHYPARNFVYVSTTYNTGDHFFALYADGGEGQPDPVAWSAWPYVEHEQWGSFASPSVHHDGLGEWANQMVIGCDNYTFFGYYNQCQPDPNDPDWPKRWSYGAGNYVSATAGLTPSGHVIFWSENGYIQDVMDLGSNKALYGATEVFPQDPVPGRGWVMGAPVVDVAGRFYINTLGPAGWHEHAAVVLAYRWPVESEEDNLVWTWGAEADLPTGVSQRGFGGPPATDHDGTLICASFGYLFALRPPVGDFGGGGSADISDLGPMRMALLDPVAWDEQYGSVYGINLLGVGDADNDDAFGLSDVRGLITAVENGDNDWATREDWTTFREAVRALYTELGMEE